MRGMIQATTNTIGPNLVLHLQTCMAVCAGSLADPASECELVLQVQKAQTLQEVAGVETEGGQ